MRRFEFQEGTSHKFWEVSVEREQLIVRFGKVGTQGQTKPKTFDSEDVARREAEKLVAEKLRKGYVEVAAHDAGAPQVHPGVSPAVPARGLQRVVSLGEDGTQLAAPCGR